MRSKKSLRLGVRAMAAALVAACGSDGSSGSGGNPADQTAGAAECGPEQAGGTATLVQFSEPRTLDPALMGNTLATSTLVGNALFGQLLTVRPDGEIGYDLAESLETTDDGTTWRLTLRDGLTFTDGTPLDAAAVQGTWKHLKTATGSTVAPFATLIDSMNASGQTLEFTLTRPVSSFAETITNYLNWIAKPEALAAGPQAFDANPIGAGPFVLESWQRSGPMTLTRNEDYYDPERPYLDELVLLANPDGQQRLPTVATGSADGTLNGDVNRNGEAGSQGLLVTDVPASGSLLFRFNTRIAPFDDERARLAVAQALDLDAINEVVFFGEATVPETLFPEDSGWNGGATLPDYDPEAAQELFDELADEGTPVEFTITAFPTTGNRRAGEALQAQLSQYENVSAELEVPDFAAAISKMNDRTFQMVAGDVTRDALALHQQYHSTSPGNFTGISDPELDAALEAGLATADPSERAEVYQEFAARFSELMPDVLYARADRSVIHNDRLQGIETYGQSSVRTDTLCVTE